MFAYVMIYVLKFPGGVGAFAPAPRQVRINKISSSINNTTNWSFLCTLSIYRGNFRPLKDALEICSVLAVKIEGGD